MVTTISTMFCSSVNLKKLAHEKIIQGSRGALILFFGNEFYLKLATNSLKVASSSMLLLRVTYVLYAELELGVPSLQCKYHTEAIGH
jgi:hypothetical protein